MSGMKVAGGSISSDQRLLYARIPGRGVNPWRLDLKMIEPTFRCPSCGQQLDDVMFEKPWFEAEGGFPGDSGQGGNTPQDPVAWGMQTCPECDHQFWAEG